MNDKERKRFSQAINFAVLIFGLQMTMLGPLLEDMAQFFGMTAVQAGSFFSLSAAGFAVAIVLAGIISDRIGKKQVVVVSAFAFAVLLLAFALSPWLSLSLVLFFAVGGFGGVIESTLSALVADINPGKERRAVTYTHVFFGIGAVAGPVMGGWIADQGYPWQAAYAIAALLALVSAVWLKRFAYPPVKPDERLELAAFAKMMSNRGFLLLCLAVALYVGVETSVWGWTPKYLGSELHYTPALAGAIVSVLWGAIIIGRLITSQLAVKYANRQLVGGLCLITMIGLVSQLLPALRPYAPGWFILIGLGLSGIWPLVVSQAGIFFQTKYTGTAFGLAVAAGGVGGMIVPYLFGLLSDSAGMGILVGLLSIPVAAILWISVALGKADDPAASR